MILLCSLALGFIIGLALGFIIIIIEEALS